MKFAYISKTLEAPREVKLFGYTFILDGHAVEIDNKLIINKLSGMEHVGIIEVGKLATAKVIKDEKPNKKKPFSDCFLELSPNATRQHIIDIVNSKSGDYLIQYVSNISVKLSKEDTKKIKQSPQFTKSTLVKYVIDSLKERFAETKEEKKDDAPVDEIAELVNSKSYNELQSFVKAKGIKIDKVNKENLIEAITEYLKENGTN